MHHETNELQWIPSVHISLSVTTPEQKMSQSHCLSQMDQRHLQRQPAAHQNQPACLDLQMRQAAAASRRDPQPMVLAGTHQPELGMHWPGAGKHSRGHPQVRQSQAVQTRVALPQKVRPAAAGGQPQNPPYQRQVSLVQQTCPLAEPC